MKMLICALTASAIAVLTPTIASAADLGRGYYEESEAYIERPVPPPVRVERYYEPDYYYDDVPVVTYYRRPYPYFYAGYPYWGPRRGHWRGGWGHRAGWGHRGGGWGHRGRW